MFLFFIGDFLKAERFSFMLILTNKTKVNKMTNELVFVATDCLKLFWIQLSAIVIIALLNQMDIVLLRDWFSQKDFAM